MLTDLMRCHPLIVQVGNPRKLDKVFVSLVRPLFWDVMLRSRSRSLLLGTDHILLIFGFPPTFALPPSLAQDLLNSEGPIHLLVWRGEE